jgi:hypothetical protein
MRAGMPEGPRQAAERGRRAAQAISRLPQDATFHTYAAATCHMLHAQYMRHNHIHYTSTDALCTCWRVDQRPATHT